MNTQLPSKREVCSLSDIEVNSSAGFLIKTGTKKINIMVIRNSDNVYTYINRCPHIGTPLDFRPGQFLDTNRKNILCSTHGALFRIKDGLCTFGPCKGKKLEKIINELRQGKIYITISN